MIATLLSIVLISQSPGPRGVESLRFDPAEIARRPRVTLKVVEEGREVTYQGVPLETLLPKPIPAGPAAMAAIKGLSDAVILIRGSDGYQVAVSAAAAAMDPAGERFLLAVARDGQPLDARHGPVQLIVPGDPKRVRWCHTVTSARLVHVGALADAP